MKSKMIKVAFVAAIAMVSGINVFNAQKTNELSDIALANVEALASSENKVTCVTDEGDICTVGSVAVPDWDEDNSWF